MPLYEFVCPKGHKKELLKPVGTLYVQCAECGEEAIRQISTPTIPPSGTYSCGK